MFIILVMFILNLGVHEWNVKVGIL